MKLPSPGFAIFRAPRRRVFFSTDWRHGQQLIRKDTAQSASRSVQTFT